MLLIANKNYKRLILLLPLDPVQPLARGPRTKYIQQEDRQSTPRRTLRGARWTSWCPTISWSCILLIRCCRSMSYLLHQSCRLLRRKDKRSLKTGIISVLPGYPAWPDTTRPWILSYFVLLPTFMLRELSMSRSWNQIKIDYFRRFL